MKVLPVPDKPMLRVSGEEELLVVADLHIGLEAHLSWKGFHIPSQTVKMEAELLNAAEGVDTLIILGDVKHRVPGSTRQEHREIPRFFESLLQAYPRVRVVRGNHDAGLDGFLPPGVELLPASGALQDDVGMVHGHTLPSARTLGCRVLLSAHNHSRVSFAGARGSGPTEPCWLRIPFQEGDGVPDELLVLPAFNPNLGGSPVNVEGEGLLGPVLNSELLALEDARVYLMDGAALGRLPDLSVPGRRCRKRKVL